MDKVRTHRSPRFFFFFSEYNYDYDYDQRYPAEDPYIHLHKEELTRSALLFGVGVLKGVAVTALVNAANDGNVSIGK